MTASDEFEFVDAEEQQYEESTPPAELRENEKKAFLEFKNKVQEAILNNHIFQPSNAEESPNTSPQNETQMPESDAGERATDISIWGVPLVPSRGFEETDTVLLKFLRARDFRVSDALDMLCKTLRWRKEYKIDGILDEELGSDLQSVVYVNGADKKGHPLYYNIYGAFKDKDLYQQAFGTEEKCDKFMRWRIQIMEKGVRNLSFMPGGVCSMVQITDLKNVPGPAMKEWQSATKKAVTILQDNYPEFLDKNIFINVPFWYYAYHTVFSRVLTQRTKNKLIFARPAKVAETLLKYIAPENIPIQYGGLKREDDVEFPEEGDKASEMTIRGGGIGTIGIPVTEQGVRVVWDVTVVGWDVTYMEEFIPDDDCSYKILIRKEKKIEECVRNSFYINEPGKIVLTIENRTYKRKKVFYRSKIKPATPLSNFLR